MQIICNIGRDCSLVKYIAHGLKSGPMLVIIDRESGEIIRLVASVRASVCLLVYALLILLSYTMHVARSGRYMGLPCRVLRKITMTHGIQSKISVCLSVIRKHSWSRAARSGRGLLISAALNHYQIVTSESHENIIISHPKISPYSMIFMIVICLNAQKKASFPLGTY